MDINIKDINQYASSSRIRVSVGGITTVFVVVLMFGLMSYTASIDNNLKESNELRRQQLDVAKQQYKLDSLRFEYMKKHEKTK